MEVPCESPPPAHHRRGASRWGWRWAGFLMACAAILCFAAIVRLQDRAANLRAAAARAAIKTQYEGALRAWSATQAATGAFWRDPWTGGLRPLARSEIVAQLFPDGEPPSTVSKNLWGQGDVVSWYDARRGFTWQFEFGPDGRLTGQATAPLSAWPAPPSSNPVMEAIEPARYAWSESFGIGIGPLVWAGLLVATFSQGVPRRSFAHLQMAAAVSCLVAAAIDQNYLLRSYAVLTQGLPLRAALITIVAGVVLFFVTRHRRDPGRCTCGYDLTGNESGVCPECGTPRSHEGERVPSPSH